MRLKYSLLSGIVIAYSEIVEVFENIAREIRETHEKEKVLQKNWFYFRVFRGFRGQIFLGFDVLQFSDCSVMSNFTLIYS